MSASTYLERLEVAQAHMDRAKLQFSEAARVAMRGDPQAPELAAEAFKAITAARAELRAIDAEGRQWAPLFQQRNHPA